MINNSLSMILFILVISIMRSILSSADTLAYSKCIRKAEQTLKWQEITFPSTGTKSQGFTR